VNGKNIDFSSRGVIGNLFAGYGYNFDRFYIGAEGFFYGTSNRSSTKNLGKNPQVQRYVSEKYGYGVSLIPGVMVTDGILLYIRGGAVRARFQINDTTSPLGSPSSNNTITGWQAGGGGQFALTPDLDLRVEYVYSGFNSNTNINGTFTPDDSNLTLGVVYKFA
jgi:opacity protein-like surface antigen